MALQKRCSAIVLTVIFVGSWMVGDAEARGFRSGKIPNVPASCNTCHTTGGGTPRNPFGLAVEELVTPNGEEVFWGAELAALDSDGDGFTNGEELGDPDGTWQEGDAAPGTPDEITHPGDPDSHPPIVEEPTAVEESSWGKLKRLVKKALE
jgi:hypothetical protein